ncbi:MAG: hypothetical protein R3266_12345, partial [Gemmatimonadota bacterium]|nr:hypothetical protein [Gemmatimonadota bacterium]
AEDVGPRLASSEPSERDDSFDDPLGLEIVEVAELSRTERRRFGIPDRIEGVVVVDGDRRGAVGRVFGGVPEGVVITDINGRTIETLSDYERAVSDLEPGDAVSMVYMSRGTQWSTAVTSLVIPER